MNRLVITPDRKYLAAAGITVVIVVIVVIVAIVVLVVLVVLVVFVVLVVLVVLVIVLLTKYILLSNPFTSSLSRKPPCEII